MIYGLSFKGINSKQFALTVKSDNRQILADVVRFTKSVPGFGVVDFGNDTYNEKTITVTLQYNYKHSPPQMAALAEQVGGWLYDDGTYYDLIFDDAPLRKYRAKCVGKVDLTQGNSLGTMSVSFTCNPPYPFALDNSTVSPADVAARLLWDNAANIGGSPIPLNATLKNSLAAFLAGTGDNGGLASFIDGSSLQLAFNGSALGNIVNPQFKSTGLQEVQNGNFASGTTGWANYNAVLSAAGGVLSATGSNAANNIQALSPTNIPCITGRKIFVRASILVTDSVCQDIRLAISGTSGGSQYGTPEWKQTSPTANQWYYAYAVATVSIVTGNIQFWAVSTYADATTANGKVMQIQNVVMVDMGQDTTNLLYNLTAGQMNTKYPNYIPYQSSALAITGTIGASDRFTWDGTTGKIDGSAVTTSGNLIAYQNGNIFVQNSDGTPATVVPVSELTYYQGMTTQMGIEYIKDIVADGAFKFTVGGTHAVLPKITLIGNIPSGLQLAYTTGGTTYYWQYNATLQYDGILIDCAAQTVTRMSDGANLYPNVSTSKCAYFSLLAGQAKIDITGSGGAWPLDFIMSVSFTPIP